MVETAGGLAHLDDIVSVQGVDAVYIGPSDLALAVGQKPGPRPYEALADHLAAIKKACRAHGVALGIHALTGETAAHYVADGYDMITVGSDASFLASAVRANLDAARAGLAQGAPGSGR